MSTVGEYEPGTVLRGKYRVEGVLGRGGMGYVLAATHLDLEQRVALKLLHRELRTHAELVERFLREGRAASKIRSEHVARVLDVDRLEDGTPILVMEYLEGSDLSAVRRSRTPLPIRNAVDYVLQACVAIAEAHARGIVHRDLKTANLFLARQEDGSLRVKVLDFGISKLSGNLGGSEPSMTSTSVVMGSAEYMSPEQMLSAKDVDVRTDIWALGVVLFELLTAAVPFAGETLTQVCAMVMSQEAPKVRFLRPEVPETLEAVVARCLQKERDRRYPTVNDLARELRECLSSTHIGLGPTTTGSPDVPSTEPAPAASPPPVDAQARVSSAPPHGHAGAAAGGTSILPEGPWSPAPGPRAAAPAAASPSPAGNATSVSAKDAIAQGALPRPSSPSFSSAIGGSQHGSPTNVGIVSDPLQPPPRSSSRAAWLGGAGVLLALALAAGGTVALSKRASAPASSGAVETATSQAERADTKSAAPDDGAAGGPARPEARATGLAPAGSAAAPSVAPTASSLVAAPSALVAPDARVAAPPPAKPTPARIEAPTPPRAAPAKAAPVKTSGID